MRYGASCSKCGTGSTANFRTNPTNYPQDKSRKDNDSIQSKEEPKLTESHSENINNNNQSKDTASIQPTEIELLRKEINKLQDRNHVIEEYLGLLRKEINKLQDRNHVIEEYLRKQLKQKKHGRGTTVAISIAGSILLAIGLGFNGAGSAMIARGSYPSGYGYADNSGEGLVMFVIGLVFIILGVRIIARA